MKKKIENHEELLKQLALQGDPHAFFLLGTPYFRARYLKERSNGATHQDAQTRILADAMELLENLQHVAPARFDAWFEEHCTMFSGAPQDDKPESAPDKKIATETGAFLSLCSRELLRMGSDIKKARWHRQRRFPHVVFRNKIAVNLWVLFGVVAVFSAVTTLMVKLQTAVVISLDTPWRQFSMRFPPTIMDAENVEEPSPLHLDPLADSGTAGLGAAPVTGTSAALNASITTPPSDSMQQTGAHQGSVPPGQMKTVSPTPAVKRALPPVVPRARLILPPMPPQSTEPVQSTAPVTDDPANAPSTSVPPLPVQELQEEPASSY
ncbi:MAG: hypothetical protein JW913_01955 [Chitinispirillaceae bacterium]|nr:hypothetical protein [Chitinispirillaceae bacterium]